MTKYTALPEKTLPVLTDILSIVDEGSPTPASQKISLSNFLKIINSYTSNALDDANDVLVIYDSSGSVVTKLTVAQLWTLLKATQNDIVTTTNSVTLTNKTLTSPAITTADEDSPTIHYAINEQTGTTYTPVLADAGKIITLDNAGAITFTIPPNSSVAYNVGSSLTVIQKGAGQVTFAQGTGVTIVSTGATPSAPKLRAQYSSATAIKIATDTWIVIGDII